MLFCFLSSDCYIYLSYILMEFDPMFSLILLKFKIKIKCIQKNVIRGKPSVHCMTTPLPLATMMGTNPPKKQYMHQVGSSGHKNILDMYRMQCLSQ